MIEEAEARFGFAPADLYTRILDLGRPWQTSLRLVDFHGNYGSQDFPAADARYTEIRPTALGRACAAAELDDGPPLPLGLIFGNLYKGGTRPPFAAQRVKSAIGEVLDGADDAAVRNALGSPEFPTGSIVTCDLDALLRGERVLIRAEARVTARPDGTLSLSAFPPDGSPSEVASNLHMGPSSTRSLLSVEDLSSSDVTDIRLRVVPGETDWLDRLQRHWGFYTASWAQLPAPAADWLRGWVASFDRDELTAGLALLSP